MHDDTRQPSRPTGAPPGDLEAPVLSFDEMGSLSPELRTLIMCNLSPEQRALIAEKMIASRQLHLRHFMESIPPEIEQSASTLATEGIADLGVLVDAGGVAEMRAHFAARPVYEGHVITSSDGVPRDFETLRQTCHYACYARDDVLGCPRLIEIANDPRILKIAQSYLGCPPTIYNINAWWSFAQSGTPAKTSQALHRDLDDFRFVTMFIYLTTVGRENGAHRYIKYSHDKTLLLHVLGALGQPEATLKERVDPLFAGVGYQTSQAAEALVGPLAMVWTGAAGSAILADTYGLHMGIPLTWGERLMVWVRYGLGPNVTSFRGAGRYAALVQPRIPQTPRAQYINRLLLTD